MMTFIAVSILIVLVLIGFLPLFLKGKPEQKTYKPDLYKGMRLFK